VLDAKAATQVDVLEQHSIVLVLSEKTLFSYPLDALTSDDAGLKRPRKISHANFFKAGICQGQQLVCCVKTSALSTTIKVYEPMDNMARGKAKGGIGKMFSSSQDSLKALKASWLFSPIPTVRDESCFSRLRKEFYIPTESTSIHFLRSKLCVGCARGFEVVSLETLETQTLLDQADTSLDFVQKKENIKPIHIERIATEFLLCYTDYSFYVNRNGWRARSDWIIEWEGTPQAFAIFSPYILAFEPSFIEIRNMDTGALIHIETAKNIRMLHSSSREVAPSFSSPPSIFPTTKSANTAAEKDSSNNCSLTPPCTTNVQPRTTRLFAPAPRYVLANLGSTSHGKHAFKYQIPCSDTLPHAQILYAYEDEMGEDVIASLDFWSRPSSPPTSRNGLPAGEK